MTVMPVENLPKALNDAYPELGTVRKAAEGEPVFLVGGAVRDLLLERGRSDMDLVVIGDATALAHRIGEAEIVEHERFATAKIMLDGHQIDIAAARAESYPRPGALPEVEPTESIERDLGRRDFTINAMAVPLGEEARLIDPYGGRDDLEAGLLRVLHPGSFADDPTRALRAARYAARFVFEPDPETAELLRAADLGSISADRRSAEMLRVAAEPNAPAAFELLSDLGLVDLRPAGVELAVRVIELLASPPWRGVVPRDRAVLAAAIGPVTGEEELASKRPERPSLAVELAQGRDPVEWLLARAMGAEWLERYLDEWAKVNLEIDGDDLIAAGVEQGPAVGVGLAAALRDKLDGVVEGRDEELRAAIRAARETGD
jgi:tRNA nucleotidyltransferase (CCA-adding enzyme)